MILKIIQGESVDFFDNVKSIMVRKQDNICEANEEAHKRSQIMEFSVIPCLLHPITNSENFGKQDPGVMISFLHYDEPYELYANCAVYLMNDDGKTIERLY